MSQPNSQVDSVPSTPQPPDEGSSIPRARLGARAFGLVLATALVAGGAGGVIGYHAGESGDNSPSLPVAGTTIVDRPEGSVAEIAQAVLPSVVKIEALASGEIVATGSGFIIRNDGYIVTNAHVSDAGDGGLVVVFSDGTQNDATLVGESVDYDLAVLKVDRSGLVPLVLGDSDSLVVGDPVIAVGSPLGLDSTVTTGIVSALHRPVQAGGNGTVNSFIDAIQTDAAINPGNSGGPLLNGAGQVIGITSAIAALPGASAQTGAGSVGLGFAIPSNQVRRTAEQIIDTGHATYPVVGVLLDATYVGEGVKVVDDDEATGTVGVLAGGPADRAGIKAGDIILAIDGRPVTDPAELIVAIRSKSIGDTVTLTVKTGDETRDVVVTLSGNDTVSTETSPDN